MTDDGVPNDEMPTFPAPRTTRPTRADELADRLLAGDQPSADAPAGYAALAELFSAAAEPGSLAELSSEQQARSLFRAAGLAGSSSATSPHSRRKTMLSHLLTAKLAAAIAAGTLSLGGTAAAAYASALPSGLQDFAHDTIGAPAPATDANSTGSTSPNSPTNSTSATGADDASSPSPTPTATPTPDGTPSASAHPVGPNAAGPAAYGLCTAFAAHQAHGSIPSGSVAFRNLAAAAGGAENIAAYCATIPHPGSASDQPAPTPTAQPSEDTTHASEHGKPTALPSQASTHATEHRTGKPSALPSQASTHAGEHRTGKPTALLGQASAHASQHGSGAPTVSPDAQP